MFSDICLGTFRSILGRTGSMHMRHSCTTSGPSFGSFGSFCSRPLSHILWRRFNSPRKTASQSPKNTPSPNMSGPPSHQERSCKRVDCPLFRDYDILQFTLLVTDPRHHELHDSSGRLDVYRMPIFGFSH